MISPGLSTAIAHRQTQEAHPVVHITARGGSFTAGPRDKYAVLRRVTVTGTELQVGDLVPIMGEIRTITPLHEETPA